MEEGTTIDQYISKMLLDDEWGGHAVLLPFWDIRCSNISVWFVSRSTPYSYNNNCWRRLYIKLTILWWPLWLINAKIWRRPKTEINHKVEKEDLVNKYQQILNKSLERINFKTIIQQNTQIKPLEVSLIIWKMENIQSRLKT